MSERCPDYMRLAAHLPSFDGAPNAAIWRPFFVAALSFSLPNTMKFGTSSYFLVEIAWEAELIGYFQRFFKTIRETTLKRACGVDPIVYTKIRSEVVRYERDWMESRT
jgi:hypothetical protein